MSTRRVKITKGNIDKIRKELDFHLVSLTLTRERELIKKYAPKTVT